MESAQKELMCILLGRLYDLGLLSKSTYQGAENLVHSMMNFPDFFESPASWTEECDMDAGT
jgi:hypothetical protein